MKIRLLLITVYTTVANLTVAQNYLQALNIGDTVPEIVFHNVLNYPGGKAKLSDFKGKLIILDFWNLGCSSCIAGFPKMEKLQKEFEGKIQILLVNTLNPLHAFKGFPEKSRSFIIRNTKLPFVLGCDVLREYFPHSGEPFHVWIDDKGTVKALTDASNATSQNILTILEGKEVHMTVRQDILDLIEPNKSLIQLGGGKFLNHIQYYSIIMNRIPGFHSISGGTKDSLSGKSIGFRIVNMPITYLYKTAYYFNASNDRIILEVPNPENYIYPRNDNKVDDWTAKNVYSYESKIYSAVTWACNDEERWRKLRRIMQHDLERFFEIKGTIEKRNLKCFVLLKTSGNTKLKTFGGEEVCECSDTFYMQRSYTLEAFINTFISKNRHANMFPVVDETGFTGKVDLDIHASLEDMIALRKELAKYGLDIREAKREVEVLVLRKNDN